MRRSATMRVKVFTVLLWTLFTPSIALAQASIAGAVKDTSGAVLPGVTVEASSPALIEKVRSVVTDGNGQYKIVDLRPGSYVVTFMLAGFSTIKREGIELVGSFAATVDAELKVGVVAETVTVTGGSPIVDIQNVKQEQVISSDVVAAIPTGRTSYTLAVLVPGITNAVQDVGGTNNLQIITNMAIHGGRGNDTRVLLDGLSVSNIELNGQGANYVPDTGAAQEVTIDYAAGGAEQGFGGPAINLIPKEGGNTFGASFFGTGVNSSFEGNNYTQALQNAGLKSPNTIYRVYDVNPGGGGPIVRDKLWVYASARWQANETTVAGVFANANLGNPSVWTYVPDTSHPAIYDLTQRNVDTRLTWQATPSNKFGLFFDSQTRYWLNATINAAPEAVARYVFPDGPWLATASWSSQLSSRLLLDVRASAHSESYNDDPLTTLIPVLEQSTNFLYRAGGISGGSQPEIGVDGRPFTFQGSLSYVTGSHALKVGASELFGHRKVSYNTSDGGLLYQFNKGVPNQITEYATPVYFEEDIRSELALYAQDKWTVSRLTLNAGVRFDYQNTNFPAETLGPGPLVPTRNLTFPETAFEDWKDITPRLGAAYDLFGTGKTAVKVNVSKYVIAQGLQGTYGDSAAPFQSLGFSTTRSWIDTQPPGSPQYYTPLCDLTNPAANGECGAMANANFGRPVGTTIAYDPKVVTGWGTRPYDWEFSSSVQQQLAPSVSVTASYVRRWYGNFTVVANQAVPPSGYSPYCVTAPSDSRLTGGGSNQICGLYNLNPGYVGQVSNLFTAASDYGADTENWNGFDFSARVQRKDVLVQGGLSTGRTLTDDCSIVMRYPNVTVTTTLGTVQSTQMCHQQTPFITQVKLLGVYSIPRVDVQVAGTFQSLPGPLIAANDPIPNAVIAPSLGRNLSANAANATINLVSPGTQYGQRLNQLDLRFSKTLKIRQTRTSLNLDLYNALNSSAVLTQNNTYGSAWQVPMSILLARFAKISVQFDFK